MKSILRHQAIEHPCILRLISLSFHICRGRTGLRFKLCTFWNRVRWVRRVLGNVQKFNTAQKSLKINVGVQVIHSIQQAQEDWNKTFEATCQEPLSGQCDLSTAQSHRTRPGVYNNLPWHNAPQFRILSLLFPPESSRNCSVISQSSWTSMLNTKVANHVGTFSNELKLYWSNLFSGHSLRGTNVPTLDKPTRKDFVATKGGVKRTESMPSISKDKPSPQRISKP